MQITIEVQNVQKIDFLLELLRGLNYVKILRPSAPKPTSAVEFADPNEVSDVGFREFLGISKPNCAGFPVCHAAPKASRWCPAF